MGLRALAESVIDISAGGDIEDIKDGSMVAYNKKLYKCIDTMGKNSSFIFQDKKGRKYIYRASDDSLEDY